MKKTKKKKRNTPSIEPKRKPTGSIVTDKASYSHVEKMKNVVDERERLDSISCAEVVDDSEV